MYLRKTLCFVLLAILSKTAFGQSKPLEAVRISKPPTIDGIISDDEWKEVQFVEGLFDANSGAAYSDGGRFWLAYDKEFVYFAARLHDSNPKAIRATEYRTNVGLSGDDSVMLALDLSGSMSATNTFQINPLGGTNIRIAGGRAAKREWLGAFTAKARITETGWEAEAKIPWQSMSIPAGGRRNVRFNIQRFVARTQRYFTYVFVPETQIGLTPVWSNVELPQPTVDRSIKLLPYTYVGYDPREKAVLNAGLDLKTSLTGQINLVGSINPDFRNVENQILSIDFSRFERLADESRPFFQEGSSYSDTAIFASQRIRRFDVGVNTYGRINDKTSFSLIETADFGRENAALMNVSYDPNPNDSLRASVTSLERGALSNKALLLRYSKNIGAYNLFLRDMESSDTEAGFGRQFNAAVQYSKSGLGLVFDWTRADPSFRPRLGFFEEVDYVGPFTQLSYNRNYDRGPINDWGAFLYGLSYNRTDGRYYRKEAFAQAFLTIRPGIGIATSANLADFEGSKDSLYSLNVGYPRGNPYANISMGVDVGRQAGLSYRSATFECAYRLLTKLQLSLRHQSVEFGGSSDQTVFSLNYDLGNDRAISGRMVRRGQDTNAYLAYRRSGNKGIEYFLILGDPNAPKFRGSLILKVVLPIG